MLYSPLDSHWRREAQAEADGSADADPVMKMVIPANTAAIVVPNASALRTAGSRSGRATHLPMQTGTPNPARARIAPRHVRPAQPSRLRRGDASSPCMTPPSNTPPLDRSGVAFPTPRHVERGATTTGRHSNRSASPTVEQLSHKSQDSQQTHSSLQYQQCHQRHADRSDISFAMATGGSQHRRAGDRAQSER